MPDPAAILYQHYGPIAFGLVALLIIWKLIVSPELAAARKRRDEDDSNRKFVVETLAELKNVSALNHATAKVLASLVKCQVGEKGAPTNE